MRLISVLSGLAISAVAGSAIAEDWSGPYLGLNLGYATGSARLDRDPLIFGGAVVNPATTTDDFDIDGGLIGISAGYNWQRGPWVYGAELSYSMGDISGSDTDIGPTLNCAVTCDADFDNMFMLRAKLGKEVSENLLVYGTAGLANADFEASSGGATIGSSANLTGWTIGLGVERKITDQISIKAEYSYLDFGSEVVVPAAQSTNGSVPGLNIFSIGVNFGF